MTPEQIAKAIRCPLSNVQTNLPGLLAALEAYGINSQLVQVGLLGTIAVETAWTFQPIHEFGGKNPTVYFTKMYEGKLRLGNTQPGDGARYHGRGYIQVTGRSNYRVTGQALGVDLEGNPDLALDPAISAKAAAHYFAIRHVVSACDAADWQRVRRLVNGGLNGWEDFNGCVQRLLGVA